MYDDQLGALKPQFLSAKNAIQDDSFFRHNDVQLLQTQDPGPWKPSQLILEHVPNLEDITVEIVTKDTNLVRLDQICRKDGSIGLVLMGNEVSRYKEAALIILTTRKYYFAFDPKEERSIKFIKAVLKNPNLNLWTTAGLNEADCLLHKSGISLLESNANCALGLHLHLMKALACLPKIILEDPNACAMYPERALWHARGQPDTRLLPYHFLVDTWLDIPSEHHHDQPGVQMVHLDTRPLSETAINLIKRRCCLVLPLVRQLQYCTTSELMLMNHNMLNYFQHLDFNTRCYNIMKDQIDSSMDSHKINGYYFSHLDTPNELPPINNPAMHLEDCSHN